MDVLTQFWTQARKTWGALTPGQRTAGAVLVALMAVALGTAGLWGGQADFTPLFTKPMENPQELGSVLGILKNADIPVRQENGQILVPASVKERAFIELSGKSAWPQDQSLDELKAMNDDWRMSDQGRRDRARLMLQNRLSRMIGMMEGVQSAAVLLAEGNNSVFSADHFEAKATVQVILRPRVEALSPGVAETVRRVVAFGVTGIKPAAVAVVDSLGRIYEERGGDLQALPDTFEKLRRAREEDIIGKVRNALAPLAGSRIAVTASVELNQDRVREEAFKVNPDEVVVDSEHTKSRTQVGSAPEAVGVPGVGSNVTGPAEASASPGASTSSTEEESEIHRTASTMKTETVKAVGDVRKVTVGVLVPYAKGSPEPDAKFVGTCRDFVMKAAGISDPQFVTVSSLAYDPAPAVQPSRWEDALAVLLAHGDRLGVVLLAVGALVVLGLVLRRGSARPSAFGGGEEGEAGTAGGVEGAVAAIRRARGGAEPLPEMSPEGVRFNEMESRVREMVRKDPRLSAGLVKRWLMASGAK